MLLFFIIGVWISNYLYTVDLSLLVISLLFIIIGFRKLKLLYLPLVLIGSFYIGIYRGGIEKINIAEFGEYYSKTVEIQGVVSGDTKNDFESKISFDLIINKINSENHSGLVRVSSEDIELKNGDRIQFSGRFFKNNRNYVGKINNAKITKIYKSKSNLVADIRISFSRNICDNLNQTESALALGFLIGEKDSLPSDFSLALQAAGLTHIVVASGYNLTILVRLVKRLFQKISKYLVAFLGFTLIIGFLMITGLSPSMFRASIVAGLSLLAWYYGRNFHPLVLILIAMGVTVFIDPYYIWGNLSWQLSFAAFAGVLVLAPLITRYLFRDGKTNFVFQILVETFSAQVLTAPLIVASFGQFSNISIIANLFILPLVPLAMLLTFIAGTFGVIFSIFVLPAKLLLDYMVSAINFFGNLPWAISKVSLNSAGIAICYLFIGLICVYLWRTTKYNLRDVNIVE